MPKFAKGHVRRPDKDHLFALSKARHGSLLKALRAVSPPPTWDSRTLNWVGAIKDQGQCGSCWDFSGAGIIEIAYNKVGIGGGPASFILSEEYMLSCTRNGGCNGDDNTTVLDWAKTNGLPLSSQYGPYTVGPAQCVWNPAMALYSISDWGFADPSAPSAVPAVAAIKAAIMQYGAVGCGIAADDAFQAYTGGLFSDSGATAIDHDVILVGWNDDPGYWILRNSWGTVWGANGYMNIAYGANQVGNEAVWVIKHP